MNENHQINILQFMIDFKLEVNRLISRPIDRHRLLLFLNDQHRGLHKHVKPINTHAHLQAVQRYCGIRPST